MRVTNEKQGLLCVKTPEFLENTALIYAIYTIHKKTICSYTLIVLLNILKIIYNH